MADRTLRDWSQHTFAPRADTDKALYSLEKRLDSIESMGLDLSEVGAGLVQVREELWTEIETKADASRIDAELHAFKTQLEKAARLSEFRELYEKVVPPAEAA